MSAFDATYWNLRQLLAWVYLGSRKYVEQCADGVTDHGHHFEEHTLPDGRKEMVKVSAERPDPLTFCLTAAYEHGTASGGYDEAVAEIIGALEAGTLIAYGRANNEGDRQEIPCHIWPGMNFSFESGRDADFATPKHPLKKRGATHWNDLRFLSAQILNIWGDPFAGDESETAPDEDAEDTPRQRTRRTREDLMNFEIEQAIKETRTHDPATFQVMDILRTYAIKPRTCIIEVADDGVIWKRDHGQIQKLTNDALKERLRRRRAKLASATIEAR